MEETVKRQCNMWTEQEEQMLMYLYRKIGPKAYCIFERHPTRSVKEKARELGVLQTKPNAMRGRDMATPKDIERRIKAARAAKDAIARMGIDDCTYNMAKIFCGEFDRQMKLCKQMRESEMEVCNA